MALDANLLDDGGPDQEAVNAMRPKRKRIKPWEDPSDSPLVSSHDRGNDGLKPKYGQKADKNTDTSADKYGQPSENTDKKYGQNKDAAALNTDMTGVKYGHASQDALRIRATTLISEPAQPIPHEPRETQAPKKIGTKVSVPIFDPSRPHFEDVLSVNQHSNSSDNTDKLRSQTSAVPNKQPSRPDFEIRTPFRDKYGQLLPPSPQKLALLELLRADQEATGLGHTRMLSTTCIAQELGIPVQSVRKQLDRMKTEGRIERVNGRRGRGVGGCIYKVSAAEIQALRSHKYGHMPTANTDKKYGQTTLSNDSSSRSLNKHTTTKADQQRELLERFELLLDRINPHEKFELDSSDVAGWWRKVQIKFEMSDEALVDFEESLERWIAKYTTTKFSPTSVPKAVLAGSVLGGLCGKIPGFMSWSEKQANELEAFRKERLLRARERQLAQYNDDFEIWFTEAADDALWACVPEGSRETVKAPKGKPLRRGPALKGAVMEQYAAENGLDFEHWQHLSEQLP